MGLQEKVKEDTKAALREKNELRLSVLRMLSAAMHNRELEKRAKTGKAEELNEEEFVAVLCSEAKKRRDAIEGFEKGGRRESAEKESAELKILEEYLPQEMSDEEIEKIAREVVAGFGEVAQNDFGKIMGEVMKKVKGQASGNRISQAVRKLLQPSP